MKQLKHIIIKGTVYLNILPHCVLHLISPYPIISDLYSIRSLYLLCFGVWGMVYGSCTDRTSVGVWKLATTMTTTDHHQGDSAVSSSRRPPFTKIIITKLLGLENEKTRNDYFKQQSEFFAENSRSDELVQFSTHIEGM